MLCNVVLRERPFRNADENCVAVAVLAAWSVPVMRSYERDWGCGGEAEGRC